jgi:hypothetical protein
MPPFVKDLRHPDSVDSMDVYIIILLGIDLPEKSGEQMKPAAESNLSWRTRILIGVGLPALSMFFLYLEHLTHIEFLLHVRASGGS